MELKELKLYHNVITKIDNLQKYFSDMILHLTFCRLKELLSLHLQGNRITKITGLKELIKLHTLRLDCNQISDIEGLQNNRALTFLDLSINQISTLSVSNPSFFNTQGLDTLKVLKELHLNSNKLSDLKPLIALPQLEELQVSENNISSFDVDIPALQVSNG